MLHHQSCVECYQNSQMNLSCGCWCKVLKCFSYICTSCYLFAIYFNFFFSITPKSLKKKRVQTRYHQEMCHYRKGEKFWKSFTCTALQVSLNCLWDFRHVRASFWLSELQRPINPVFVPLLKNNVAFCSSAFQCNALQVVTAPPTVTRTWCLITISAKFNMALIRLDQVMVRKTSI